MIERNGEKPIDRFYVNWLLAGIALLLFLLGQFAIAWFQNDQEMYRWCHEPKSAGEESRIDSWQCRFYRLQR